LDALFEKGKDNKIPPKHLMLLGRAGIGKTTLCHYIVNQWRMGKLWNDRYDWVFLIPLRNLNQRCYKQLDTEVFKDDIFIEEIIWRECFSRSTRQPFSREKESNLKIIENILKESEGRTLFILDGYDEIAPLYNEDNGLKGIVDQLTHFDQVIITTRPYSVGNIRVYKKFEIIGFLDDDIERYIEKHDLQGLSEYINRNPSIKGLLHVPINMALFGEIWKDAQERGVSLQSPLTMTQLYIEIEKYLLTRYLEVQKKESTLVARKYPYKKTKPERAILSRLAYEGIETGQLLINFDEHERIIEDYCDGFNTQSEALSGNILRSGFVNTTKFKGKIDSRGDIYFIHLTLQEYFAAQHWVNLFCSEDERKVAEATRYFKENQYDPRYKVIWYFVSGTIAKISNREKNDLQQRFWDLFLREPRDLVGLADASLMLRCLEETKLHKTEIFSPKDDGWLKKYFENTIKYLCSISRANEVVGDFYWKQYVLSLQASPYISNKYFKKILSEKLKSEKTNNAKKNIIKALLEISKVTGFVYDNYDFIADLNKMLDDEEGSSTQFIIYILGEIGKITETAKINELLIKILQREDGVEDHHMNLKHNTAIPELSLESDRDSKLSSVSTSPDDAVDNSSDEGSELRDEISSEATSDGTSGIAEHNKYFAVKKLEEVAMVKQDEALIKFLENNIVKQKDDLLMRGLINVLIIIGTQWELEEKAGVLVHSLLFELLSDDSQSLDSKILFIEALGVIMKKGILNKVIIDKFFLLLSDTKFSSIVSQQLINMSKKDEANANKIYEGLLKFLDNSYEADSQYCVLRIIGKIAENNKKICESVIKTFRKLLKDKQTNQVLVDGIIEPLVAIAKTTSSETALQLLVSLLEKDSMVLSVLWGLPEVVKNRKLDNKSIKKLMVLLEKGEYRKEIQEIFFIICKKYPNKDLINLIIGFFKQKNLIVNFKSDMKTKFFEIVKELFAKEDVSKVDFLLSRLDDKDSSVRFVIAQSLGQVGQVGRDDTNSDKVIAALLKHLDLDDEDSSVRSAVAQSLGEIVGRYDYPNSISIKAVVSSLLKHLDDKDSSVKSAVAQSLGEIVGRYDYPNNSISIKAVVLSLLKHLDDKDSSVRSAVAQSLGKIVDRHDTNTDKVIEDLLKHLNDKDSSVRSAVAQSVGFIWRNNKKNEGMISHISKYMEPLAKTTEDDFFIQTVFCILYRAEEYKKLVIKLCLLLSRENLQTKIRKDFDLVAAEPLASRIGTKMFQLLCDPNENDLQEVVISEESLIDIFEELLENDSIRKELIEILFRIKISRVSSFNRLIANLVKYYDSYSSFYALKILQNMATMKMDRKTILKKLFESYIKKRGGWYNFCLRLNTIFIKEVVSISMISDDVESSLIKFNIYIGTEKIPYEIDVKSWKNLDKECKKLFDSNIYDENFDESDSNIYDENSDESDSYSYGVSSESYFFSEYSSSYSASNLNSRSFSNKH